MTQETKLQVVIIGAGLAGLAAARITREHHDVTVFERASVGNATGGQGICFFPGTVKILRTMGYDEQRGAPCHDNHLYTLDKVGSLIAEEELHYEKRYGAPMWSQLRSDCRDELFRLATAPPAEVGMPNASGSVKMVYDVAVMDVEPESGIITLADGSKRQFDLVIIADGIHSRLRKTILGADPKYKAQKMGLTIFRVAVSAENARKVLGDDLPYFMKPDKDGKGCATYYQSNDGTNRLIVTYPLHRFDWIHISLHLPTGSGHGDAEMESWHADANRAEIIEAFSDFDESIMKLVKVGTHIKVWDMQDLDPIPFWNKGRAILIGDAAHAMTPMQGQGGNMAVEDAEAFRLFTPNFPRDRVPEILAEIDSVRRPRTAIILQGTRATVPTTNMKERVEKMDYSNSYHGIRHALSERRTAQVAVQEAVDGAAPAAQRAQPETIMV